jgi:hypothetical protein
MRNFPNVGVQLADILLPTEKIDLRKWAVIACDQFTSQPEYWQRVADTIGDVPSTYKMILPEVFLGTPEEKARLQSTQKNMQFYLKDGTLKPHEGLIYVERSIDGKTRHGLMLALDLEKYDFNKGSQSLIRATEGTILDRLPPRIKIRQGAALELPHILVLIDDPQNTVFSAIEKVKDSLPTAYDFELMQNSGHLCGRFVNDAKVEAQILSALEALAQPETFQKKYSVGKEKGVLLFAVGDCQINLGVSQDPGGSRPSRPLCTRRNRERPRCRLGICSDTPGAL